jgi:O-acetyl-ADP-ribose deacetylase (regulator of RNase III)
MITEQTGDVLKTVTGVICQQVNCQGVMGCGIALAIRRKWPKVYTAYREKINHARMQPNTPNLLNSVQLINVGNNLYVANMFAQFGYGRDKRYTDYEAFITCLVKLLMLKSENCSSLNIYFPYKIGCSNAGGDWNIVKELINVVIPTAIIVKKGD